MYTIFSGGGGMFAVTGSRGEGRQEDAGHSGFAPSLTSGHSDLGAHAVNSAAMNLANRECGI